MSAAQALEKIRDDAVNAYLRALWLHMDEAFQGDWSALDLGRAVLESMEERGVIQRGSELTAPALRRFFGNEYG